MSKKPDDAAKIAGLASILQSSNKQKDVTPPPSPAPPEAPPVSQGEPATRPRAAKKIGKYRDPNFHHYGFYLRKDTHKRVKRLLEDNDPGKDVSDLMQELLEQWLASQ